MQEKAVALLAGGLSVTATAGQLGVARQTVSEWLTRRDLSEAVDEAVEEARKASRVAVSAAYSEAVSTLREAMQPTNALTARIAAARAILQTVASRPALDGAGYAPPPVGSFDAAIADLSRLTGF